jgi:hypothetical protein
MTQFRWLLGAALLTRCGSQIAVATPLDLVTYTIDFVEGTEASGFPAVPTLPTSGTFTYDLTLLMFTSFTVDWAGATFDFTNSANAPMLVTPPCLQGLSGSAASFAFLTGACSSSRPGPDWIVEQAGPELVIFSFSYYTSTAAQEIVISDFVSAMVPSGDAGVGTWSVTAVPEPGTMILVPLALGCLAVRRRIFGRNECVSVGKREVVDEIDYRGARGLDKSVIRGC